MGKLFGLSLTLALLGFMFLNYPSVYGANIAGSTDSNQLQYVFKSNNDMLMNQISVASDQRTQIVPFQDGDPQGEAPVQNDQDTCTGTIDECISQLDKLAEQKGVPVNQDICQQGTIDECISQLDKLAEQVGVPGGVSGDQAGTPDKGTTQASDISKYRVRLSFDKITVHNDHEGVASGDGEYQLFAYVQGQGVDLTKLTQYGGNSGLTDVSSGETLQFLPGNGVNVELDSLTPLTVFTAGTEDDGCGKLPLPGFLQSTINSKILNETRQKGAEVVGGALGGTYGGPVGAQVGAALGPQLQKLSNEITTKYLGKISCKVNPNDDIGKIVKTYDVSNNFGAGTQTEKSDAGDFTLSYTITATKLS